MNRDYVQSCLENLSQVTRENIEYFLDTCPSVMTELDGKKCYTIEENEHVFFIWFRYEGDQELDGGHRLVIHK